MRGLDSPCGGCAKSCLVAISFPFIQLCVDDRRTTQNELQVSIFIKQGDDDDEGNCDVGRCLSKGQRDGRTFGKRPRMEREKAVGGRGANLPGFSY